MDDDTNKITTKDIEQLNDLRKIIDLDDEDDIPQKSKGKTKALQEANAAIKEAGVFDFDIK